MSEIIGELHLAHQVPRFQWLARLTGPRERALLGAGLAFRRRALQLAHATPTALDAWQAALDGETTVQDPLLAAVLTTLQQHNAPRQPLHTLLDACRGEVGEVHIADFGALMSHCRVLANPLGHLALATEDERQLGYLDSLCSSLQLARYWLEFADDLRAGRVYLPRDELARGGLDGRQPEPGPALKNLLDAQMFRTRRLLRSASPLGRLLGGRNGLALRVLILLVDGLLERKQQQPDPLYCPTSGPGDWSRGLLRAGYHGLRP